MNRKKITVGVLGLGVAGALVGGFGVASAAGNQAKAAPGSARLTASGASMPCWDDENFPGRHGAAYGGGTAIDAAAKYLGRTEAQLRGRLQDGASLAAIARAQGKSVTGLENAIVAAVRERLQANTRLTTEQRTALLERLPSRLDVMVRAKHEPGAGLGLHMGRAHDTGRTGMGAGMGAGMGGGMGRMGG